MRAPITLMPRNCKMDADFSSRVASTATLCPRPHDTPGSNGHISLAACPAALTCLPVSKPPLSPICAPHRLHPINLSSGAKSKALLAFHHFPGTHGRLALELRGLLPPPNGKLIIIP